MNPRARIGLLATQGVRGIDNRTILEHICREGRIFLAWSDRDWILDGATVHVSIVGFDSQTDGAAPVLNGTPVTRINADLTADLDLSAAVQLKENASIAFQGVIKSGPFDVSQDTARKLLSSPNPTSQQNTAVVKRWLNGIAMTRRMAPRWIIDFPAGCNLQTASLYADPFAYLQSAVVCSRNESISEATRGKPFWEMSAPRPALRAAIAKLPRYIATPRVTKHRVFQFLAADIVPDCQLVIFARADDYFFGLLQSSIHELWARRKATQLRERESGLRYSHNETFETFPFPWPPGDEPRQDTLLMRITAAAEALNEQRENWLNPPEWVEQMGRIVDRRDRFEDVPAEARPLVRWSAIMAAAAEDARWKKRTLTNLYNERPTWLRLAHLELDRAVLAAYASIDPEGGWSEDWAEVWEPTGAGKLLPLDHPLAKLRGERDQQVLANLLRLNLNRSKNQGP